MAMTLQLSHSSGVMAEEHAVSVIPESASNNGPAWDEQIVPTLRKRLEAESQYLSNRLSNASAQAQYAFSNASLSSDYASPSSSQPASYLPLRDREAKGTPTALPLPVSSRTRSTPLAPSVSSGAVPKLTEIQGKSPSPNPQTRIPIAHSRSGSNTNGSSSIPSSRHTSPLLGVSPPKNFEGSSIPVRALVAPRTRKASIDSIDLKKIEPQSSLRDERPPFLLSQSSRDFDEERSIRRWELDTREALDIARKGHTNDGGARERRRLGGEDWKRQRADTLMSDNGFNANASPSRLDRPMPERNNSAISAPSSSSVSKLSRASVDTSGSGSCNGVSGIPRSSTSGMLGLGIGQPSTPINKHQRVSSTRASGSKLRSKPSPNSTLSSISTGINSQTPRSMSLNMLSSINTPPHSRLGIAAHFKPPESGFTPPRGQDWDDVVLPAVAKKMGTSAYNSSPRSTVGDVESFVVEWDRDGTPLKWQKGKRIGDKDGNESMAPTAPATFDYDPSLPRASPASSAFSPTFEMSPDNPFPSTPTRQGPSFKRGTELDLLPTTKFGDVDTASGSPAPLSSGDGPSASPKHDLSSKRSVSRKASYLKSTPSIDDLKSPRAGGNDSEQSKSRAPVITVEPATPFQNQFPPHSTFPPPTKWKPQDSERVPQKQRSKRDEDVVKKGTCCIIM